LLPAWWHHGSYAAFSLATGYVALALLCATLLVTPVYRLRKHRRAPVHTAVRRSLGVHAGVLAIVHMVCSFPVHLGGDVMRFFFDGDGGLLTTRFGLANWLGLLAVVTLVPLLVTSTDSSIRRLGPRRWKRLHWIAVPAAALSFAHAIGYESIRGVRLGFTVALISAWVGLTVIRVAASRRVAS
jgi:sulfoxide reductase heme-binding subunit YedZ